MSMMYNNNEKEDNDNTSYNYESLIEDKDKNMVVGEVGKGVEDSSNFFMQGSMKDNYKIVDNNFKEIAEKYYWILIAMKIH